jgi:hypothetical protein
VVYDFPRDLSAAATLLLVAFQQRQQQDVNTWLPVVSEIANRYPDFAFFEVPLIGMRYRPARAFIDGGMRAGIPDPKVRATTVTAYQRVSRFLDPLGLQGTDDIVVLLVDASGVIRWSAPGALKDSRLAEDLQAAVASLIAG